MPSKIRFGNVGVRRTEHRISRTLQILARRLSRGIAFHRRHISKTHVRAYSAVLNDRRRVSMVRNMSGIEESEAGTCDRAFGKFWVAFLGTPVY